MANSPIPLTELTTDQEGAVVTLRGGSSFVSRLATLGFTPGARLTMVQNYGHGPLIVRVRDTRIALGRGEAIKIVIQRRTGHGAL
jgi:ferrous iron transport protein A